MNPARYMPLMIAVCCTAGCVSNGRLWVLRGPEPDSYWPPETSRIMHKDGVERTVRWGWGGPRQEVLSVVSDPQLRYSIAAEDSWSRLRVVVDDRKMYLVGDKLEVAQRTQFGVSKFPTMPEQISVTGYFADKVVILQIRGPQQLQDSVNEEAKQILACAEPAALGPEEQDR